MSPEVEDFLADSELETICKCEREDHGGHTDHRCADGQPENEPGKGSLTIKGDPAGDEGGYVQEKIVLIGKNSTIVETT